MKNMKYRIKHSIILGLTLIFGNAIQAHSQAYKPTFVDQLVTPYLQIQASLAGDDLAAAKNSADKFLEVMKSAPDTEDAQGSNNGLIEPSKAITQAADIKSARTAFLDLSLEMIPLIKHVGTTHQVTLYTTHCPMAFGGKGGDWVQSNTDVTNPYYGAMMLHCGTIKEKIAGK